jgi:hypothetical protein
LGPGLGIAEFLATDRIAKINSVFAAHHEWRRTTQQPPIQEAADALPDMPARQFRSVRPPVRRLICWHKSTIEH